MNSDIIVKSILSVLLVALVIIKQFSTYYGIIPAIIEMILTLLFITSTIMSALHTLSYYRYENGEEMWDKIGTIYSNGGVSLVLKYSSESVSDILFYSYCVLIAFTGLLLGNYVLYICSVVMIISSYLIISQLSWMVSLIKEGIDFNEIL